MAFDANDLSPHELFVVDRTRDGEIADFTPMVAGGIKPSVRAGFLRKLLLELDSSWTVRAPGVRLKSVRIDGALDLTDCSGAGGAGLAPLSLEACDIPALIDLSHTRLARVSFKNCRMRRLDAAQTTIDGELDLSGAAPLPDESGVEVFIARLAGASIDGDLRARGAKFSRAVEAADHDVLVLDGARIAGAVLMDQGFEAFGSVRLVGARIGKGLHCDGGQFLNRSDDGKAAALVANGARIEDKVCLLGKFRAEGEVNFHGAHLGGDLNIAGGSFRNDGAASLVLVNAQIGGQMQGSAKIAGQVQMQGAAIARNVDLRGAEIVNLRKKNGAPHASEFDRAIDAANLRVGGAVLLQGANIKGEVFLADARIDGYLAFGGARLINSGGWAVRAANIRIGGNLTFKIDENGYAPHGQKTVIEGGAKFDRAQIAGALAWLNLELRGAAPDGKGPLFSFADATIEGPLQARQLNAQQDTRIDLSGASCNALDDDLKTGWGVDRAGLDLDGFSYQRIEAHDERWRLRLNWLKRGEKHRGHFLPQPYAQLAQVYSRSGRREHARRISLAQHDQRTFASYAGPLTWALSSLFGVSAGYGFAPIRAVRALVLFLALGIVGVLAMEAQGALTTSSGLACGGAVDPALYALDVALPVIDLGQEKLCSPGRAPRAELFAGFELKGGDRRMFEGAAMWRWAQALYALLGAILTALAAVTFSGVMKPRDD